MFLGRTSVMVTLYRRQEIFRTLLAGRAILHVIGHNLINLQLQHLSHSFLHPENPYCN